MDKIEQIEKTIRLNIPELTKIKIGQIFYSKYYGKIIATKVDKISEVLYNVYGFDLELGLPRSVKFPSEVSLVGEEIMLNDVLIFFVERLYSTSQEDKHLSLLDMILSEWNFAKKYLKDQNENTIDYLFNLMKTEQ